MIVDFDPEKMIAELEAAVGQEELNRLIEIVASALDSSVERDLNADMADYIEYEKGQKS